ncbi:hypothetical protein [Streptomyces sp. SID3343]|uniref:hypothetical protein n=1 Tax=Streptomyces sp. SID3343 TaxID=2690260 RepID=UPI001370D881|nr:hypothetical protein [Streptomyces sp. SID3343]MYW05623.1 hypothetical protein [Streptomyces sp. SID3343]
MRACLVGRVGPLWCRLDVHLLGTDARVRLEGVPTSSWREIETVRRMAHRAEGTVAPFTHPTLTPGEIAFRKAYPRALERARETAFLGSALLRRLMIFRNASGWHDLAGHHQHRTTFAFRMTFGRGKTGSRHRDLVRALTDPLFGIALVHHGLHGLRPDGDDCRFVLDAVAPVEARVDLQFMTVEDCAVRRAVDALRSTGCPQADIDRYATVAADTRCHHPAGHHSDITEFLRDVAGGRREERDAAMSAM